MCLRKHYQFSELDIVGIYTKFKAVDSDHQEIVLVGDTDE